jgi:hypothetical protein
LERTIVWKSINQSIKKEEEPWAERRRDREVAFVFCGDHHPGSSSSVVLCCGHDVGAHDGDGAARIMASSGSDGSEAGEETSGV